MATPRKRLLPIRPYSLHFSKFFSDTDARPRSAAGSYYPAERGTPKRNIGRRKRLPHYYFTGQ